jgi:hypothetical protein
MDIFVDDVLRVHTSWTLLFAIIGNITVHRKQKIKKSWRQQHIYKNNNISMSIKLKSLSCLALCTQIEYDYGHDFRLSHGQQLQVSSLLCAWVFCPSHFFLNFVVFFFGQVDVGSKLWEAVVNGGVLFKFTIFLFKYSSTNALPIFSKENSLKCYSKQ